MEEGKWKKENNIESSKAQRFKRNKKTSLCPLYFVLGGFIIIRTGMKLS